jgi:hypothetical protein
MADLSALAHRLKWKWGGHLARMYQRRGAHAASLWDVRTAKTGDRRPNGQIRSRK